MSYDHWLTTEPDSCDPGRTRTSEDYDRPPDPLACDWCGMTPLRVAVSLASVGIFCSHACADHGAARHEAALLGKRR